MGIRVLYMYPVYAVAFERNTVEGVLPFLAGLFCLSGGALAGFGFGFTLLS